MSLNRIMIAKRVGCLLYAPRLSEFPPEDVSHLTSKGSYSLFPLDLQTLPTRPRLSRYPIILYSLYVWSILHS